MTILDGQRAFITGAAGGIGSAIVARFLDLGATVFAVDIAPELGMTTVPDRVTYRICDLTDSTQVEAAAQHAISVLGGVDIVVNNAGGIRGVYFDLVGTSDDDWSRTIDLNVGAAFLVSRAFLPHMLERGHGSIVNVGSAAALAGPRAQAAYAASKGAVISLTRAMAMDYADRGVRVNCVCPGLTETPPIERMFKTYGDPADVRARFLSKIPMGRMARPAEVANVVAFVASEDASYMTGSVVPVDGGWTAH